MIRELVVRYSWSTHDELWPHWQLTRAMRVAAGHPIKVEEHLDYILMATLWYGQRCGVRHFGGDLGVI
jgi:hypothetical protein